MSPTTSKNKATPASGAYRPDIDGLRAIAVLSVIVFHIDKAWVPGGFVGVDMFFVISGYLISLNLFNEQQAGRFSLLDFYRRRVKRIAPAMLVVVAATLLAAHVLLLPEDTERAAESALWSVLSLANAYFWTHQDTSYFAAASSELPLLHLWSLGVEEQFYVLWPLLLLAVRGAARGWGFALAIGMIALGSFWLAQDLYEPAPLFAYYMLPTRAGELLLGALLAFATFRKVPDRLPARWDLRLAVAGLGLLAFSLAFVTEASVFPGWLSLPPTMGTALLILAGRSADNPISGGLACRPLVWVGLVSYSAYLWHWPLLAFYRYGHTQIGSAAALSLFLLTFACAYLTYRYVETPARRSKATAPRVIWNQYALPAGALAIAALAGMYLDGYGLRWMTDYRAEVTALRRQARPANTYDYVCQVQSLSASDARRAPCVIGDPARASDTLLWGDSNAAHYVGMVGAFAQVGGFRFRNLEIGACPPLDRDPTPFVQPRRLADCRRASALASQLVGPYHTLIISADWPSYQARSGRFLEEFFDSVRALTQQGKRVIIIGKIPAIPGYDRRCREKALGYPGLDCPRVTAVPSEGVVAVNARLKQFAEHTPQVSYFDPTRFLCPDGVCEALNEQGEPRYYDTNHLTIPMSWKLGWSILRREGLPAVFRPLAANPRS